MKFYIAKTPLDQLHSDFIPIYNRLQDYAEVTALFVCVAGVLATVVKSSRN